MGMLDDSHKLIFQIEALHHDRDGYFTLTEIGRCSSCSRERRLASRMSSCPAIAGPEKIKKLEFG